MTDQTPRLLTTGEVARIFRVNPKTVTTWGARGWLRSIRTLGGHRRFFADEVEQLLGENRSGSFPADTAEEL